MQLPLVTQLVTQLSSFRRTPRGQIGAPLLGVASALVGVAIEAPDPWSRIVNGISGVLWVTAAALLLLSLWDDPRFWSRLGIVVGIGMALVLVVRPSDLLLAVIGFGLGGAAMAWLAPERGTAWGLLLPALWLPEHLLTAVARAVYRAVRDLPASIRSEPPPTAALVPFAMVAAAWVGAFLALRLINRRR
jgi:hypothetical protein